MSTRVKTGHIGVNVSDLERAVSFYQSALELELIGRSDAADRRYAFLGADGTLMLTLWEQAVSAFDATSAGLHHLSFQVDDAEAVRAAEGRLQDLGASFLHDGIVAHGEGASSGGIFFTDPDGTRLEIYAPSGVEASAPSGEAPTCGFF
jgi:catechol 2,3-dioxygenase-like lactoylglutathione lyase family enzyme